jgi:hypothetical protein
MRRQASKRQTRLRGLNPNQAFPQDISALHPSLSARSVMQIPPHAEYYCRSVAYGASNGVCLGLLQAGVSNHVVGVPPYIYALHCQSFGPG